MENKEILLSIYPNYIELIKTQKKNFEFRSFNIHSETNYLTFWIYVTAPIKSLKYKMIVKNPVNSLKSGMNYFMGNEHFYQLISDGKLGYEIIHFEELLSPISLEKMKYLGVSAPQGFTYIKNHSKLREILNSANRYRLF